MAIRLNANIVALRTQAALVRSDRSLGAAIERLSSGIRIRSSADDPAGLTIANIMQHQLRGITQATENVENGISMVQTAEGGMDQISAVLLKARGLAVAAANEAPNDESQLRALQSELDNIIDSVTSIAESTMFAGIHVLSGGLSSNTLSRGVVDPADNANAVYQALTHDLGALPGGIADDTAIAIEPPSSSLYADRISVTIAGAPGRDTPLSGLTQLSRPLDATQGDVLTISGGEQLTIRGPLGEQQVDLQATSTISDLVQTVNATTSKTGATASYDETTGALVLHSSAVGHGALSVHSDDLSGGGNVGLWDVDTNDPMAKRLASNPMTYVMDFTDRTTAAPATANSQLHDLVGNMTNPAFSSSFNALDGKHLTIFGPEGHDTMTFEATSLDDILDIINNHDGLVAGTASYDAGTNTLSVTDTGTMTTTNTALTDQTSLRDVLGLLDAGLTSSADLAIDQVAGTITVTNAGEPVDSLTLEGPSLQDVLDFVNSRSDQIGATARLAGGRLQLRGTDGPVIVSSDDLTRDGLGFGLLDLATGDVGDSGGTRQTTPVFATVLSDDDDQPTSDTAIAGLAADGTILDAVDGANLVIDDGVNPALTIGLTSSTTIADLTNAINGSGLQARADYVDGVFRVVGTGGSLSITADDMTASANSAVGLLDGDSSSASNGVNTIDDFPTTTVTWTDADGDERSALLHQVTTADGGRTYRNLTGGPAVTYVDHDGRDQARFDSWEPGAWDLTLRDRRPASGSHAYQAPVDSMTATRRSTMRVQSGGATGQHVTIDVRDMRAAALGHRDALVADGFRSLQDLKDRQAFMHGFAQEAIRVIDAAIEDVSSQRGATGAIQAATLEPTLTYLQVAIVNLSESESRLRDTDFAKESAEFAKQNIKVQAATAMLAQANQVPQSVLQLLQ